MDRPIRDPKLLEAIEACRPGSDDLADPALAEVAAELAVSAELEDRFSRLQKLDVNLAGAIQDVPVPEGLADRLLARLHTAQPAAAGASRSARARRWLVAAAAALAVSVFLALGLLHANRTDPYTGPTVLEEAIGFFSNDTRSGGALLSKVGAPHALPLSSALVQLPDTRWRRVTGFLDCPGVAYDLTGPRGMRATLYVVPRMISGLPAEPPPRPAHGSGNCSAAAWQQDGLLYVLVVQGDAAAYAEFLDLPRGPLT